ncbi:MAG TPA: RagB/SusD family nutrient uptake outer membrane protein [Puia sp.]|nr:RagB/SusD family nutrient uptake outer membrane protein [Puia sp.]
MKSHLSHSLLVNTFITSSILFMLSCSKLVGVPAPVGQLTNDKVFADSGTAVSAVAGMYITAGTSLQSASYQALTTGCAADELLDFTNNFTAFYNNAIDPSNSMNRSLWSGYYQAIYQANAILENTIGNTKLNSQTIAQFASEAKFIRAFCYFHLVNLYGAVPLVLQTNVTATSTAPRAVTDQVFSQIATDLTDAAAQLPDNYPTVERVRANKSVVLSLLSIVYLYMKDWAKAEAAASNVISDPQYELESDLSKVFLANSSESIFQFWAANGVTPLGQALNPGTNRPNFTFTDDFVASMESGDARMINWAKPINYLGKDYYYPNKFKNVTTTTGSAAEYIMVLRLAEIYLVRAEARAEQNNLSGAYDDLNIIRARAALPALSGGDQATLLLAIEKERRVELAAECGRRWYDLNRTGRADAVLGAVKPNWTSTDALYPVPVTELSANPNLVQNPGY